MWKMTDRRNYHKMYYLEHIQKEREYGRKYYLINKQKQNQLTHQYYLTHKKNRMEYNKQWRKKNPDYRHEYYLKNIERHRETTKIWKKNNPRAGYIYSYELQNAINNVRYRDNNTCQWDKCGLTHKQTQIDVNHIFPKSEYPELELVEQYMICYCGFHHAMFHNYRGDEKVSNWILGRVNARRKNLVLQ